MRRFTIPLLLLCAACGYRSGSYSHPLAHFEGKRQTVGCLDIAVDSYRDGETRGPAAVFTMGNRCDAAVLVDLRVKGRALFAGGETAEVRPYDPDNEIVPVYLEGRSVAREYLEFAVPKARRGAVEGLCLDLSRVDAEAPPARGAEICLEVGSREAVAEVGR